MLVRGRKCVSKTRIHGHNAMRCDRSVFVYIYMHPFSSLLTSLSPPLTTYLRTQPAMNLSSKISFKSQANSIESLNLLTSRFLHQCACQSTVRIARIRSNLNTLEFWAFWLGCSMILKRIGSPRVVDWFYGQCGQHPRRNQSIWRESKNLTLQLLERAVSDLEMVPTPVLKLLCVSIIQRIVSALQQCSRFKAWTRRVDFLQKSISFRSEVVKNFHSCQGISANLMW